MGRTAAALLALAAAGAGCHDASCGGAACGGASAGGKADGLGGGASPMSITVSATTRGAWIDATFAGLSFEKGYLARPYFQAGNGDAVGLFALLGASLVRIGGGTCDQMAWVPDGPGQVLGQVAKADVDALAAFLSAVNWTAIYCVNLETSTPSVAAAEATYVAQALGARLAAIEIGNEPDNYPHAPFAGGWGPTQYAARWSAFAQAVGAAVPGVPLAAPALAELAHDASWMAPLFAAAPLPSLVTQHYYASEDDRAPSIATLVSDGDVPFAKLAQLDQQTSAVGVSYRMAETSSYWGGGAPGVSDAFAAALWSLDYLFAIAARDGLGANFHSFGTHPNSVLADANGTLLEVRPLYYGLLLFSLAGGGAVLDTTQDAQGLEVSAHALSRPDGTTGLVLVNRDASHAIAFTIDLGHKVASASLRELTAPSLAAQSGVTLQGASVGLDGTFAPAAATRLAVSGTLVRGTMHAGSAALVDVR